MQFFRDMSVRAKLFSGFGAVLALSVIIGVVLMTQMGSVQSGAVYLGTNALPSVQTIGLVDSSTGDYRTDQLNYVLETNNATMQALVSEWKAVDAGIQTELTKYQSMFTNAQDKQDWTTVKSEWDAYKAQTANLEVVGRSGVNAASLATVHNSRGVFDSLSKSIDKWRQDNVTWANEQLKSNDSTFSSAKTLGIALLVSLALVSIGIAFLVSRSIKRGVDVVLERLSSLRDKCATNLKAGIEALAKGDLTFPVQAVTKPIENPSKDEIGQVAAAVNGVRDRFEAGIEAYNQTRANLNEIVGQVSGSAGQVSAASQQMASTSEESGRATGEIANAVGGIAQGAERQVHAGRAGQARGRGGRPSGQRVGRERAADGRGRARGASGRPAGCRRG